MKQTLINQLRAGVVPTTLVELAGLEGVTAEHLAEGIIAGHIVAPANNLRHLIKPCAVGKGLRTKVNANIGSSQDYFDIDEELAKLAAACKAGADAVMDLSTGGDITGIQKRLLAASPVPFGTVPIYQASAAAFEKRGSVTAMTADDIFDAIEAHAKAGVDFVTVHVGVTRRSVEALMRERRVMDVVSRGGALLVGWMAANDRENPLFEDYDRLIEIALRYDLTLSLGDGMRPGCLADAGDAAQIEELRILGELQEPALEAGVQVMIEGPGHVPIDQIEEQIMLEKELCNGAPFYVLGPLVTDVGAGRDHIAAAIGGTVAAMAGADFLCYVTPREHLGLPTVDDVIEGVHTLKLAAHAGDIAKRAPGAWERDLKMAKARKALNWKAQMSLALDTETATRMHAERSSSRDDVCTMCGELCAMKVATDHLGDPNVPDTTVPETTVAGTAVTATDAGDPSATVRV